MKISKPRSMNKGRIWVFSTLDTDTCESILSFYSYNGTTNYMKCKIGGLQGEIPEIPELMVFVWLPFTSGVVFSKISLNLEV